MLLSANQTTMSNSKLYGNCNISNEIHGIRSIWKIAFLKEYPIIWWEDWIFVCTVYDMSLICKHHRLNCNEWKTRCVIYVHQGNKDETECSGRLFDKYLNSLLFWWRNLINYLYAKTKRPYRVEMNSLY